MTGSMFELPSDAAGGPPEAPRGLLCDWIVTRRGSELACYGGGRLLAVGTRVSTEGSLTLSLAPGGPAAALHLCVVPSRFQAHVCSLCCRLPDDG